MATTNKLHVYAGTTSNVMSEADAYSDYENGAKAGDTLSSKTMNTAIRASTLVAKALVSALTKEQTTSVISHLTSESVLVQWIKDGLAQTKVNSAANADTVNGLTVKTAVPENAVFTDTTYDIATSTKAGLILSQTTGTVSGRDYNVQVGSDGKAKVNVPWRGTTLRLAKSNETCDLDDDVYQDGELLLGNAAGKNVTTSVIANSGMLPTADAVYTAIPRAYKHRLNIYLNYTASSSKRITGNIYVDFVNAVAVQMHSQGTFKSHIRSYYPSTNVPYLGEVRVVPANGVLLEYSAASWKHSYYITGLALVGESGEFYIQGTTNENATVFEYVELTILGDTITNL